MFDDIIEYENEHTGLDFKAIQYKKEKHTELLKDIVAMSNANFDNDRLLIIGVKHHPNGDKQFFPIAKDEFIDASIYQQIIHENIEPELSISYEPYEYKENLLGILKIEACENKPYMLKKDYGKLKKGDGFIRKGTMQMKMMRADFDDIYSKRYKNNPFKDKIELGFSGSKILNKINVKPIKLEEKYSDYEICEEQSFRLNIDILNKSFIYIEDASVEIVIKKEAGIFISAEILEKPNHSIYPQLNTSKIINKMAYPTVEERQEEYFVSQHIGNIQHQRKIQIFNEELRMVIYEVPVLSKIVLKLTLYGKNLPVPLEKELIIRVTREE